MATRVPIPYLRLAICGSWISVVIVAFALLGRSVSLPSVILLISATIIAPCVFLALWNDGPPATVAELLRSTEERPR